MNDLDLDYDGIKGLAKQLRRPAVTLLALAMGNDPFYVTPGRLVGAKWFAKIWRRLKLDNNVHIRRVHYILVSLKPKPLNKDGVPYQNTEDDWRALATASRDARLLGLVPASAFVDRRNNEPIICFDGVEPSAASSVVVDERPNVAVQSLDMPDLPSLALYRPNIPQRYHVELWCEKTTVNDVLEPLAARYNCNIITGAGELSLTHCEQLVDRAIQSERPVRILYISDFDPAGMSMPVAVARKIEYRLRRENLDLDIQVRPIILTDEQCERYELPRTPIKKTESRADRFEERFGEGATELDALEAIHPGELNRIVEREIGRYYDDTLRHRVEQEVEKESGATSAQSIGGCTIHIKAISLNWNPTGAKSPRNTRVRCRTGRIGQKRYGMPSRQTLRTRSPT